MSDQKRASLTTIGTGNSDKKSEIVSKKTTRIVVTLSEPNEDSCPVFDYTKLCRSEEKKKLLKKQKQKPNGSLLQSDDDDDDVRRIARQFEEKYGTGEKKHRSRCQTYAELGAGYDETDSFIDNTDAYDEALPEEFQTPCGGYYINSGRLEFKRVEVSDHSDIDEIIARRRRQRKVKVMDEEKEEEDVGDEEEEENEATNDNENESSVKVKEEQKKEEVVLTVPKKVKISEDKVAEPSSVVKDKPAGTALPNIIETDNVKAKKRKLQIQGTPEDAPSIKQKKKALTVKALLEEKRVTGEPSGATDDSKKLLAAPVTTNYKSVNDIIESVVRGKEDSNSSSVSSKSQSDSASLDSEESQDTKSGNTPSTPLPDGLLPEAVELVFRIKHLAATTSVLTRKALSEDINNCLISLDWNTKDLPSALKHSLYSHLSCYLPCTKDTLIKRTKKLIVQKEEEKLKEPMLKLKAAIDAMMPVLLDKYNKECHRLAEEQGQEAVGNSTSYKVARRKFPWNDELRGYLREMITVQLHCFNVMKLRKETSEAYVTKFLNSHVRVLWPPGWMKTSTLLREGRNSSVLKPKKQQSLNGIEMSNKNASTTPRLNLPPLLGNTTLTPTSTTVLPTYSRTEQNSFQHKLPSTTSVIPTKPHSTISALLESNNVSKITSVSSSAVLPKKSHSPGNSVTISPVKKEPFSVDALLKKNIETGFSSEAMDVKKDSVSVITMNGSPMPLKDISLRKPKKEESSSNSGDKILDLSNCTSKQQHSVIQNISSNERTAVTNGESVNMSSAEEIKTVVNSGLLSTKPKEAVASLLMSRKQRILQDSQYDDVVKPNLTQDTARYNETTANNIDHRKYKNSDTKKKHKNDFDKEISIPPPISKSLKSPPPYISSQEAERRLNEETATATDILSQIINESLLGTPTSHQHQRTYEEEVPEERKMKPRTMSGDHEAKVNQEVDQVIQDLVELRQMSGGSTDIIDNAKATYNSNPLGLHRAKSLDTEETSKHSPYSSFQDEFFKHLLKKDTQIPPITKPTPLPRHSIGPFDNNLPFTEDIPSKPSLYNSLPHCTAQSISQHNVLPSSSKSAQMNHGNTSTLGLPTGHPHRPVYFPPIGFSNDDQHLLSLTNNLQFSWPFPGTSESSPPH